MPEVNPIQLIQLIRQGQNSEQLMLGILQNNLGNTPFGANLMQLARQNRTADIEQIARNMCAERGLDFDKEFMAFKHRLGIQ